MDDLNYQYRQRVVVDRLKVKQLKQNGIAEHLTTVEVHEVYQFPFSYVEREGTEKPSPHLVYQCNIPSSHVFLYATNQEPHGRSLRVLLPAFSSLSHRRLPSSTHVTRLRSCGSTSSRVAGTERLPSAANSLSSRSPHHSPPRRYPLQQSRRRRWSTCRR